LTIGEGVDGVKYPFSTSQNSPTVKLGFTVKEIRHNVAIEWEDV
jgi:hypothetical protein